MFDFLRTSGKAIKPKSILTVTATGVDVQKDADTDRSLSKALAASLDVRTRIEREREGIELRLEKLKAEASAIRSNIVVKSADLAELDRIISGMEAHLAVISEAETEGAGE